MLFIGFLLIVLAALASVGLGRPLPSKATPSAPRPPATGTAPSAIKPPSVEPLVLIETTPERARVINAAVPFMTGKIAAARPFTFAGTPTDRERAVTCLASAVWYEAGDDGVGQRAVAQVVLNRLRHPAFPKTICGVVFQGSERQTGCQFTFTCDGALVRPPSPAGWNRARAVAEKALAGAVVKAVGTATHYHTEWVVPYWSVSLDKIAEVHTHLFFRWRGWWGQPAAFSGRYAGGEAIDPRLVPLSGPEAASQPMLAAATDADPAQSKAERTRVLDGNILRLANPNGREFGLQLNRRVYPGSYAIVAYSLCKNQPVCTVAGWFQRKQIPTALPVSANALRSVSFLYRKGHQPGRDEFLWNCNQVARENKSQCLPGTDAHAGVGA